MTDISQPARDLARIVDAARRMGVEMDEAARGLLKNLVNTFFHDRLVAVPTISAYIGRLQAEFGEDAAAAR